MNIIYEPRGRAREYAPLAVNLYRGCSHACEYCYAPAATFCHRETFSDPAHVKSRPFILEKLKKEARKMQGDPRDILLCFTCDAYQHLERLSRITRRALEILMAHDLTVTILTKSGPWGILRDKDLLKLNPRNSWAATLTHDDPTVSVKWEPGAALPADRIEALKIAHDAGIITWVSLEPVIDPEAVYRLLEATHQFVDFYKVGKLNYHPLAAAINWREFRQRVESLLLRLSKPYLLKMDLLEASGNKDDQGIQWNRS